MDFTDSPQIDSDTIILTFTDHVFLPIFNIWYDYFSKLNLPNLLVVSLDPATFKDLSGRGIRTILCNYQIKDRCAFWKFRLSTIVNIFKKYKKNLIHTDADCIWFKDVYSLIRDLPYDFIGSMEHGIPVALSKKHGFVTCCGFYYVKYNERATAMFEKIMSQTDHGTDDQVLFNYYMFDNMQSIICNPSNLIEKAVLLKDNTTMALLNESIVHREVYNDSTYCFHPWLPGKRTDLKIRQLRAFMKARKWYDTTVRVPLPFRKLAR